MLPKARTADIVVQNLQTEVLIYDLKLDKAFCLNETSAKVFNCCDGKKTFDELKRQYRFTDDLIYLALAELKANDLLEECKSDYFAGLSRREAIRRVGLASMIALPVVASITAPSAVHAASDSRQANNTICRNVDVTGTSTECRSGFCVLSFNAGGGFATRCCSSGANGGIQGSTGYTFRETSQDQCTSAASIGAECCSGAATFDGNGTCTCT